jgi:CcmD family protein
MKDFEFLFGAYLAFFLLLFGYLWLIGSRQKKIARELEHLRRTLNSYRVDNQLNQS